MLFDELVIAYHIVTKFNNPVTVEQLDRLRDVVFQSKDLGCLYTVMEDCRIKGDADPLDAYQDSGKDVEVLYEAFKEVGNDILAVSSLSKSIDRIFNKQLADQVLDSVQDIKKGKLTAIELATDLMEHSSRDVLEVVTYVDITHAMENREHKPGLHVGFHDLDRKLDGLQLGTFSILAARPGVGKTDLALAISRNILDRFKNVYFASLEMSRWSIHRRNERYGRGWEPKGTFWIDDRPSGTTVAQIISSVLYRKVDLVIVDYLQLLGYHGRTSGLYEKTTEICHQLMAAAKNTGVPWLVLSQLSRKAADEYTRPKLSDLRDSGAIEQDANAVMFMYEKKEREEDVPGISKSPCREVTIVVAKNREAGTGDVEFKFMANCSQWDEA